MTWRRTKAQDIVDYYGKPLPYTVRSNTILVDGQVAGIVGIARHPEWGTFFTEHKPELREHLSSVTVWRAIKDAMTFVKNYRGPVMSIADNGESCVQLARLGFTHLHGAWWGWLK